jgi:FlaA1/EpsC-like NDP-sugar epimerase
MLNELASIWNNSKFLNILERFLPYRLPFLVLFQMSLMAAAYCCAYFLRFEGLIPQQYYQTMLRSLPAVLLVQGFLFHYHDLFRGLWRYVAFADLQNILRATFISNIALILIEFVIRPYTGIIPSSVYVLNALLVVTFIGGCRFFFRHLRDQYIPQGQRRRVLMVGPVSSAEPLLREIASHHRDYIPVALVEPDKTVRGFRVYDVPIVGGLHHIAQTVERFNVQEIIFAWPDAPPDQLNEIIDEFKRCRVRYRIMPSVGQVLNGQYRLADVRDIELEDLLPRPPIYIEQDNIQRFISGKVILVTGGGGSIGSELCRQIAKLQPRTLVIFERAENYLYEIEVELRKHFPDLDIQPLVASINDGPGTELLLKHFRPDLIFHAAAYKHVPLMERSPIEAAYNNILGTRNLARAAIATQVECFVMISTDKAVNPSSVMGVSKRITEKYIQACNNGQPSRFITTRFGNVLGSAGSVIPLFKKQVAQGGPVTVTHPEIERFFMTIPESVYLVLQASYMGQGGDIFILDMGCSVKIMDLAEKLILLAGKTPGKDIKITCTGLRPGEKLYEELFNNDEQPQPTGHPMISRALGSREAKEVWEKHLDEIWALVAKRDKEGLLDKFKEIVPNYSPGPLPLNLNVNKAIAI